MPNSPRTGRAPKWIAVAAALLLPFSAVACGDDEPDETAGPETSADVGDITDDDQYFANDEFVGETVTVSAEVEEVLSQKAFTLDGGDWGDDSLLVLSGQDVQDVTEDDVVQVTGTVRTFTYDDYSADYGLTDAGMYEPYGDEEFLEATQIDKTVDDTTPTTTS